MIGAVFEFMNSIAEIRVIGETVLFRTSQFQNFGSIDNLRLNKSGVIKEFPDLIDKEDWQKQARDRFKEKIKTMKDEKEQIKYVMDDLGKFGYIPLYIQKSGFRPVKIN